LDSKSSSQFTHALDRFVTALRHHIRGAEFLRQRDPVRMVTQDNDLLRAKALSGDDAAQADGAVTNHGNFLTAAYSRRNRGMMTSPHHV
jgi:hypothetical protein